MTDDTTYFPSRLYGVLFRKFWEKKVYLPTKHYQINQLWMIIRGMYEVKKKYIFRLVHFYCLNKHVIWYGN